MPEEYEVCISYSRKDIHYVEQVVAALEAAKVHVFFDTNEEVALWGTNLRRKLAFIYQNAKFCVVFLSAAYQESVWTRYELGHAGMRALHEDSLLPVRLDHTELPAELLPTTCIDAFGRPPEEIADLIVQKVHSGEVLARKRTRWQRFESYVRYYAWHIAAVLTLLIALSMYLWNQVGPSHTEIRFDKATNKTINLHVSNSGGQRSTLEKSRLIFRDVPLQNAELDILGEQSRVVDPKSGGLRSLYPSEQELVPVPRSLGEAEVLRRLKSGVVTLEVEIHESGDAKPRTWSGQIPSKDIALFVKKWVADVR